MDRIEPDRVGGWLGLSQIQQARPDHHVVHGHLLGSSDFLDPFSAHRKEVWMVSWMILISEDTIMLTGNRPGFCFLVQTAENEQTFFFFPIVGDRYLELIGSGNHLLLAEIASSLRPRTMKRQE